jgi:C-terminal processing protease CtpA/Prc
VTLDRRRQRLYLSPGELLEVPYDYDLTGLTIVANGRTFAIGHVEYETPAASAGLRAGDVVVEINGQSVAGGDLRELRSSFQHDGRERVLTIERPGIRQVVKLPLPSIR